MSSAALAPFNRIPMKVNRAVISVSNKFGLDRLVEGLVRHKIRLISTGGTAKTIKSYGAEVEEISDFTGFPEILEGRVKTLHPKVAGGILGRHTLPEHQQQMRANGIVSIDLVVVNFYPFEKTVANPECTLEEAIENIDIGGPTMVRAAAKNFEHVAVVTDPLDYRPLIRELDTFDGQLAYGFRYWMMLKAFSATMTYEQQIVNYTRSLPPLE